ncbi:MAG: class I SAM-dependent methyltransferase [Microcoleus sp.]
MAVKIQYLDVMNKEKLEKIKGDLERSHLKSKEIKHQLQQWPPANLQHSLKRSDPIINNTTDINSYNTLMLSKQQLKAGLHRESIGGMWDQIGTLQFDFLLKQGLMPWMKFVDIGCGCLRGGVHFIRYLDNGNYYGIDMNSSLIDAGYQQELDVQSLKKLPQANLLVNAHFELYLLGVQFDFAIAQSVFTHLPLNHIRRCLFELAKCIKQGGKFYATFFECSSDSVSILTTHQPGGIITYMDSDPYHYQLQDFGWCIQGLPWTISYIGDWNHPRGQKMLLFTKV